MVCVTTGILRPLDAEELEGVLSHELSHVAHRDVLVMTVASLAGVIAGLATRGVQFGGLDAATATSGGALGFVVIMVVSLVVYAVSFLLMRVLSRYRELCADRAGAFLTGKPSALASALTKITGEMGADPDRDLRETQSMNAFFITPAFARPRMAALFATHPPLEKRLDQLAKIAASLGQTLEDRR